MYMSAFNMVYSIVVHTLTLYYGYDNALLIFIVSILSILCRFDLKHLLFSNIGNNCNKIIVHFLLKFIFIYLHTNVKFMNLFQLKNCIIFHHFILHEVLKGLHFG